MTLGLFSVLAQEYPEPSAAAGIFGGAFLIVFLIVCFAVSVLVLAGFWKTFVKAGEPGWACIVPIYQILVWLKIARRPLWWFFILFLVIPYFIASIDVAKRFGQSAGFGVGLALLPFIFYPVLGFGSATYKAA